MIILCWTRLGVVIDSEKLYDLTDIELFSRHAIIYDHDEVFALVTGRHFDEAVAALKASYGFKPLVGDLINERREILVAHYHNTLDYMPGFREFHAKLVGLGLETCIATSCSDVLLEIVERRLHLSKFFDGIYKLSDVGNRSKPDPAIFLYAAKQMNSKPNECFVIEDSPKGIQAAKNAGMFCIGIATTFDSSKLGEADYVADTFEDISWGE